MPAYVVPAAFLPVLAFALFRVPDGVPHRWKKISELVAHVANKLYIL
jgi:hypothetical protein